MSGWLPPGVTDADIDRAMQGDVPPEHIDERAEAEEALWRSGMEPMDVAPRNREITAVLADTLKRQRVFWHDDVFGDGCWMDADGDGAIDSIWRSWTSDELLGWLPEARP